MKMRILILGSGGREHALAWKIRQSNRCEALFIAPGNAGTALEGENVNISVNDFEAIGRFCLENRIQLVVVGPEEPLVKGIRNYFEANPELQNILLVGPDQHAAQLEGSKDFAKAFMERHQIPTAAYHTFSLENLEAAKAYVAQHTLPIVLKADGLAAGKGVVICETHAEALAELEAMIADRKFGQASEKVVVEQFLKGIEVSFFALTDGNNYLLLPEAKDYKRIGEGDTGLNTGGMGAVSPVPFAQGDFYEKVVKRVVEPTIRGLAAEKMNYKGFVFFGLINVNGDPFVIEYNVRMGDPETEVVLPRISSDLVTLLEATANGSLGAQSLEQDARTAVTVMLVSGGYPGDYDKGKPMSGLDSSGNSLFFHAGTSAKDGQVLTNGGRVLAITSWGNTITEAAVQSLEKATQISFEGKYYRRDIGQDLIG